MCLNQYVNMDGELYHPLYHPPVQPVPTRATPLPAQTSRGLYQPPPQNTADYPSLLDTNTQNIPCFAAGLCVGVFVGRGPGTSVPLLGLTSGVGRVLIPAGVRNASSCPRSQSSGRPNCGLPMCPAWRVGDVPAQQSPRSSSTVRAGVPKYPPAARGVGGWLWLSGGVSSEVFFRGFPRLFPASAPRGFTHR